MGAAASRPDRRKGELGFRHGDGTNAPLEFLGAVCCIRQVRPVAEIAVIYFAFFPVQRVVVVLVPKEIAHTLVLFPAICFKSWLIRWRLATLQVERVGFPAGSRWSAGAETFEPIVCGP